MSLTEIIQVLAGFVGALGFAILFNVRGKRLVAASGGGMLSWVLFLLLTKFIDSEVVAYFIVAAVVSIYAEVMARLLKTPTTTFIITSLIPMVPGSSLYYTMISVFRFDDSEFLQKATYTMELAAALALGVVLVTTFARILEKIKKHQI